MLVSIPMSFVTNAFNITADDIAMLGYEDCPIPKSIFDISLEELEHTFGWTVSGFDISLEMDDYFDNVGYSHIPNDKWTYQDFLTGHLFPSILYEFSEVLVGKYEGIIRTPCGGLAIRISTNDEE